MAKAFREADELRRKRFNAEAHLMGMYVYEAFCDVSPILHAFAKQGAKPIPFRTSPYNLFGEEEKETASQKKEEKEALFAEAYMRQMVRAGKKWGKGEK